MTTMLTITCRDPIVSRDGRPFGINQGTRMRSLDWLSPSMVAGSLRSTIGKAANRAFSSATADDLLRVEIAGAFPFDDEQKQLYLPAPEDCVVHPERGPLQAKPQSMDSGGCDWPKLGLRPVQLTEAQTPTDFKPKAAPVWWPEDRLTDWLAGDDITFDDHFLLAPEKESRTHVGINSSTGAADDGELFTTVALPLTHLQRHGVSSGTTHASKFAAITLAARVRAETWCGETAAKLDLFHPLGGERRLAHWKAAAATSPWSAPRRVREALSTASRVRMMLATPAVFRDGWKPAWLDGDLIGTPPGATVALRLLGMSTQRWCAVSGWSLAEPRGPKPVKRIVPSGGVYFFETVDEKPATSLADRWLESVSDDEQDRRDGFGLAVWGIW